MATSSELPGPGEQTALSADDVARLRAGYDAFVRGDIDGLLDQLHPDVEFHNPDYAIESGVRHGRRVPWFRSIAEAQEAARADS